ncbi:MAG: hypothetical protein KDD58_15215 [Bdellovibrionales bacterium]|nr:hypothetical protein [Bdellovibrionales bacterium]
MMKILILCLICTFLSVTGKAKPVGSELTIKTNLPLNPDLSFDGLSLAIPNIDIGQDPSQNCEEITVDFARYKALEEVNRSYFSNYLLGLQSVISNWLSLLEKYQGQEVHFAKGTFNPVLELVKNITVATKVLEENSVKVDNFIYGYTDFIYGCTNDEDILALLEFYQINIFDTESEVWRYLKDSGEIIRNFHVHLQGLENENSEILSDSEFSIFKKLSSYESGSSGVGEIKELLDSVFISFYNPKLKIIEQKINEATNVQRGNN